MSSEGSVSSLNSSRIRQFGLYRSIDARTEEFLRLSRRRQIRQGCACAAVSTAITVTVVVVVIFIYEFSLNSEVNIESSLKSNWFSLINDTTENGFKTKYTTNNIDKTTLTLLPILLKALKKNVILENIFEEQSTSSPSYEKKETTEYSFDKNVFTRNWFRIPSSKVYAISYKALPLSYYKSSPKSLEHFTKIRKIRDYQRIINYMDKMISERVDIGQTKAMMREDLYTEKPVTVLKSEKEPIIKNKQKYKDKPIQAKPKTDIDESVDKNKDKSINCKCPLKLRDILNKILLGIEKLLSINTNKEINSMSDCHHQKKFNPNNKILESKPATFGINEDVTSAVTTEITTNTNSDEGNGTKMHTVDQKQNITKFIELSQNNTQYNNQIKTIEISTVMVNDHLDATDKFPKTMTKPMTRVNIINKMMPEQESLHIFLPKTVSNKHTTIHNNDVNSINKYTNDENSTATVTFNGSLDFNELKLLNNRKNTHTSKDVQYMFDNKKINPAKTFKNNWLKTLNKAIYQMIEKDKNIQIKPIPAETSSKPITILSKTSFTTESVNFNATVINMESKNNHENDLLIVDEDGNGKDENQNNLTQEDMLKPVESLKDFSVVTNNDSVDTTKVLWEELNNENIPAWKSMIPNHRPIYLEIQPKNYWKHEDYDFNIINTYDDNVDLE